LETIMLIPIAIAFLLQAPVVQSAPKQADPVPPARIELTTPFPVHLGSVGPREVREAVFGVRSTHDRPFHFRLLDLSLGLALDEAQLQAALQPGEVRLLRVRVDPRGLLGLVKGAVRLGTDDPSQPAYILRYDMVVRPEISVDSLRRSFGEVAPHESPEVDFQFKREGGDPLKVVLASPLAPYLESEVVDQGTTAMLRLRLRPTRVKPGVQAGLEQIKVATNGPNQPLFDLYVDWKLVGAVMPNPSRVVFDEPRVTLQALELTARDGRPFTINAMSLEGAGFEVLDKPSGSALRHVLRIRRRGTQPEALLILHCSNQEAPLRVPLRYLDPRARPKVVAPLQVETDDHHHH
jgi:hypothetical protein